VTEDLDLSQVARVQLVAADGKPIATVDARRHLDELRAELSDAEVERAHSLRFFDSAGRRLATVPTRRGACRA
jgi:hypothetical protein